MHADEARQILLARPGSSEEQPFGPDALVYKIGGKMFAVMTPGDVPPRLNLKCDPDRALELRDHYERITPGWHMNKRHWNTLVLDGGLPTELVLDLIEHSYRLVLASLPKYRRRAIELLDPDASE